MFTVGSMPIMMYPITADDIPEPPNFGFLLITDLSNFLLTNNTPLETPGA